MGENEKDNKEIKTEDNSEIINKMYSNNNDSKDNNSKIDYSNRKSKLKNIGESEKYIKEMHQLADKNEMKTNIIVLALGIVVVSIILFSIFMNSSLMKSKANITSDKETNKEVSESEKKPTSDSTNAKPVEQENNVSKYLDLETNRATALESAIKLNKGSKTGITVYLISEILRANTYDIPSNTYTVNGLMERLTSMGWQKNTDFNELEKGDVCFTTDLSDKPGIPSHTFIFMGWVEEGKTDYANIVDGQIQEFDNVLHKRNISISTPQKDKFSYFLRK